MTTTPEGRPTMGSGEEDVQEIADELREAAEAARYNANWIDADEVRDDGWSAETSEFIAACSPDRILALVSRLAELERDREATDALCPEDFGPAEYIAALERKAARYRELCRLLYEDMESVLDMRTLTPNAMDRVLDARLAAPTPDHPTGETTQALVAEARTYVRDGLDVLPESVIKAYERCREHIVMPRQGGDYGLFDAKADLWRVVTFAAAATKALTTPRPASEGSETALERWRADTLARENAILRLHLLHEAGGAALTAAEEAIARARAALPPATGTEVEG